jgi:hypothetical protein
MGCEDRKEQGYTEKERRRCEKTGKYIYLEKISRCGEKQKSTPIHVF